MVDDPYKVLGVSRNATKEEIKKAYRQKAKECHPDLHPDDPHAEEKMDEINEAYDMLNNPEKYKKQQTGYGQGGYGGQNAYGGGSYGGGSSYGGNSYGGGSYGGGYEDPFDDFFGGFGGFGGYQGSYQEPERPRAMAGDSADIRQAVDFINMGNYQYADQTLNSIPSARRDARWYYLSALANHGLNNAVYAMSQIQKAVQMAPNNQTYRQVMQRFQQTQYSYNQNSRGYQRQSQGFDRFCRTFCLAQLFCWFCRCI